MGKSESFDANWDPKGYLEQYYAGEAITEDEVAILKSVVRFLEEAGTEFEEAIDVGSGPTIHHIIPLARYVKKIYLADYIEGNLKEIESWVEGDPNSHDWDVHIKGILDMEGGATTPEAIAERRKELRSRIAGYLKCDVFQDDPLGEKRQFPLVTSFFCADSVTDNKQDWESIEQNVLSLVAPGGWFVMSALHEATSYKIGDKEFPSAHVSEEDVRRILTNSGFDPASMHIEVVKTDVFKEEGFDGIILARAKKL